MPFWVLNVTYEENGITGKDSPQKRRKTKSKGPVRRRYNKSTLPSTNMEELTDPCRKTTFLLKKGLCFGTSMLGTSKLVGRVLLLALLCRNILPTFRQGR